MACAPGANPFIERYFLDCVYNLRDYVGFCLGLTAILFWLVAQIPQWVKNYKTKTAEALSPWFLAQWLLGDTFNLLGCLLQGQQLPTTTYTAMYFVVADVFMMMQYIYYGALQRRREKLLTLQVRRRHHRRHHHHSSDRSHAPSGDQQPSAGSDASRRFMHQQQHEQQQDSRRQWPNTPSGQHDMEYGIDGCTKQQQQQQRLLQQNAARASPHTQQAQDCAVRMGVADSTEQACGSSNSCTRCSAAVTVQQASCASQAAAAAASSSTHLLPGIGGSRSVIGFGLLVGLGLVSLLLPAASTHGFSLPPSAAVAAAVTAHPRSLEAGIPMHSGMHSTSSSSNSRPAAALAAGHISAMGHGSTTTSGSGGSSSSSGDATSSGEAPVEPSPRDWAFLIGTGLGYVSSVLYLCSRFSQIHKNYTRQSSEGLALAMFMMAVCANLCTGIGIVMRTFTWQELKEQLPWIIGSLGTITLDMIILWQSLKYGKKGNSTPAAASGTAAERQQLLHAHHHRSHDHVHQQQRRQQQQQHQAPRPGHAAAGGVGDGTYTGVHVGGATAAAYYRTSRAGNDSSSRITIPAAAGGAGDEHLTWLSSSAPAGPGWGVLNHRAIQGSSTTERCHGVAAAVDHVDGASGDGTSSAYQPLIQ